MKLLVSYRHELSTYVSREFYYVMQDLIQLHGWRHLEPRSLAGDSESVRDRLTHLLGQMPDVVLFWEVYDLCNAMDAALREAGCFTCVFVDDLHMLWGKESTRGVKLRALSQCGLILSPYAYVFDDFFPELRGRHRIEWVAHSASPDFLLPFNERPRDSILLSGFIGDLYPLRQAMKELYDRNRYPIEFRPHPGYCQAHDYDHDDRVGSGYARTIHGCKAAFTDALTFKYLVAKHFEIPATGALLMADAAMSGPLKRLGFLEYVHYVPVTADDLEHQLSFVIDPNQGTGIDSIRRRGQELVRSRHTTRHRAETIDLACIHALSTCGSPP